VTQKKLDSSSHGKIGHITDLYVHGLKSLASAKLKLKPLSLLVGMNSVGKSSVIQSILSVSQWIQSGSPIGRFDFNGELVTLGNFSDLQTVRAGETKNPEKYISVSLATNSYFFEVSTWVPEKSRNKDWELQIPEVRSFWFRTDTALCAYHSTGDGKPSFQFKSAPVEIQQYHPNGVPEGSAKFGEQHQKFTFSEESLNNFSALQDLLSLPLLHEGSNLSDILDIFRAFKATYTNWNNGHVIFMPEIRLVPLPEFLLLLKKSVLEDEVSKNLTRQIENYKENPGSVLPQNLKSIFERQLEVRQNMSLGMKFYIDLVNWMSEVSKPYYVLPKLSEANINPELILENSCELELEEEIEILNFLVDWTELQMVEQPKEPLKYREQFDEFLDSLRQGEDVVTLSKIHWFMADHVGEDMDPEAWSRFDLTTPVNQLAREANEFGKKIGTTISYLGPLRKDGYHSAVIGARSHPSTPVGASGENTPILLDEYLASDETKPFPYFDSTSKKWEVREASFKEAIKSWFSLFTTPTGDLSIERDKRGVRIKVGNKTLDQFGTGASQVLPILVLVMTRGPGDVVLIEQPELHLHPGGQQHLADFFMAATSMGVQIIAETHSEYMVNRVRRASVLGLIQSSDVQMVNFEQDLDGLAKVTNVGMTDSGGFADWPQGFFAETEADLLDIIYALEERES
jgi:predicted ATPase